MEDLVLNKINKILAACAFFCSTTAFLFSLEPDDALKKLQEGNDRYVKDLSICPDRVQERRTLLVSDQTPFAVVLGCSDSRVAPEIIFDQGIGDLFVVRVAGNVVGPIEMDSVEYAIKYLGASLVVVLGHENCGALKTILEGNYQEIEAIAMEMSRDVLEAKYHGKDALKWLIDKNVKDSVDKISAFLPNQKRIEAKKLKVVGAYYELESGKVIYYPAKR